MKEFALQSAQLTIMSTLLIALAGPAIGADYNFGPSADSYVTSEYPNSNFGDDGNLFVHHGSNTKRSFLRFDLTGIPLDETVTGASLHTFFGQAGREGTTIDLFYVSDDSWLESGITWTNQPAADGAALWITSTQFGNGEMIWTVPKSVFAADHDGQLSLLLKLHDESISDTATFFSREATINPAVPPYLNVITAPVPEAETWAMLLAGLGFTVWAARLQKSRTASSKKHFELLG